MAGKLWSEFGALRQAGRSMIVHVNDYMTVMNQRIAMGESSDGRLVAWDFMSER